MEKFEFTACSDEDYMKYEESILHGDKRVCSQIDKFTHLNKGVGVAFGMSIRQNKKVIYPIIMSDLSDDKKLEILNLIFPPDKMYI